MHVETSRFGSLSIPDDEIVTFPDGLPGFRGLRRMALLGGGQLPGAEALDGVHNLFWLQDVADPDLAFLTIVPWTAYPDYDAELDLEPFVADNKGDVTEDDLCVLAVVTIRRENGGVQLTSNLLAPVVINTSSRIGRQLILDDRSWPVSAPLAGVNSADGGPSDLVASPGSQ